MLKLKSPGHTEVDTGQMSHGQLWCSWKAIPGSVALLPSLLTHDTALISRLSMTHGKHQKYFKCSQTPYLWYYSLRHLTEMHSETRSVRRFRRCPTITDGADTGPDGVAQDCSGACRTSMQPAVGVFTPAAARTRESRSVLRHCNG